jgi:hypothetical protein
MQLSLKENMGKKEFYIFKHISNYSQGKEKKCLNAKTIGLFSI